MKKTPTIYSLASLLDTASGSEQAGIVTECGKTVWVPARPLGFYSLRYRLKATWLAFTGKADVVVWPGNQ